MIDLSVTFFPSRFERSKALGYGSLRLCGFNINYSAYPSSFSPSGVSILLPSRKKMDSNGAPVFEKGKQVYVDEVYIADREVRAYVESMVAKAVEESKQNGGEPVTPRGTGSTGTSRSQANDFSRSFSSSPSTDTSSSTAYSGNDNSMVADSNNNTFADMTPPADVLEDELPF